MMVCGVVCKMKDGEILFIIVDDLLIICDILSFCIFMDYIFVVKDVE